MNNLATPNLSPQSKEKKVPHSSKGGGGQIREALNKVSNDLGPAQPHHIAKAPSQSKSTTISCDSTVLTKLIGS